MHAPGEIVELVFLGDTLDVELDGREGLAGGGPDQVTHQGLAVGAFGAGEGGFDEVSAECGHIGVILRVRTDMLGRTAIPGRFVRLAL